MERFFVLVVLLLLSGVTNLFSQVEVKGFAPKYIGEQVDFYVIEDYFSMIERPVGSTKVKADSSFLIQLPLEKEQKIVLRYRKNNSFIYVQPAASYYIYLPEKNRNEPIFPDGNTIEVLFSDLANSDINYKILSFDSWTDEVLARYYPLKKKDPFAFVQKMDSFKLDVEKYYSEEKSLFFKTYVKFKIATLENMSYKGARNRFEKFDFFIKNTPVQYESEVYMRYIAHFYENILQDVSMELSNRFYLGLLKGSPYLIQKSLFNEYTLSKNNRLLELIVIKTLSNAFVKQLYPQDLLLETLDSLAKHPIYAENGLIAKNLMVRLTELLPGTMAPEFTLINQLDTLRKSDLRGKYIYIQYLDPSQAESVKQVELLLPLAKKYAEFIEFVTVVVDLDKSHKKFSEISKNIPWRIYHVDENHPVLKRYTVTNFPRYDLIDRDGMIADLNTLKPSPNGVHVTIESTFLQIRASYLQMKRDMQREGQRR